MSAEPSEMQQFEALLSKRDVLLIPGADEQGPKWKEVDAKLRAFVASLAKDKARVDWVEDITKCYWFHIQSQPSGDDVAYNNGKNFRAAIDAAMTGGEKS